MKKNLLSVFAMVGLMLVTAVGYAQTTYTKVNSVSEIEAGANYILVGYNNDGSAYAMSYQKTNNRHALPVEENGGTITVVVATDPTSQNEPYEFTMANTDGSWTIFDPLNNGYLCAPGGGNYLRTQAALDDNGKWTITDGDEGGFVPVSNGSVEQNIMRYNGSSTLFGCYKESSTISGLVYLFKQGGAPVINPEPSNYPTEFVASVNNLDVTLTWVDAIGDQLPSRYLVVGSKGNVTVPVDGTPVVDGDLVKNVAYGTQTVTFNGLESGATYHFAIFPYTNSGANIDYKTDGNYPTANATTQRFFLFEDFNNDLGVFTAIDVLGEQSWHKGSYQGRTYANMNGFANGVANENEDWLISPALTAPTGASYLNLEFNTAMKFGGNPLLVLISNNYSGEGDPNAADWEDITDAFDFSTGDYEWIESGVGDILDIVDQTFYLAFMYACTTEGAASWEIDYVKITTDGSVSVNENSCSALNVYPNPAHDVVSFSLENDAQVSIFDVTGRMVSEVSLMAGERQYQVANLENGVYFLNIRYNNGKMEVARFVKF